MDDDTQSAEPAVAFEQGPIRPPSEANSLLIRVTRNCPWNRCTFCFIYKDTEFSRRSVDEIKHDLDLVHKYVELLGALAEETEGLPRAKVREIASQADQGESEAFHTAWRWVASGRASSVFLQDSNSLIMAADELVEILEHIRRRFPWVRRVTSYARSHTLSVKEDEELEAIRQAGLDRVHVGLESGSDAVLEMVCKGATKEMHIEAGLKAKQAGLELSEYYMPGLGGQELSEEHAVESADALNQINADFIRLRQLGVAPIAPLHEDCLAGRFTRLTGVMMARELERLVEGLDGITSVVQSDHMMNLFADLRGKLPGAKGKMLGILRSFLALDAEEQSLYQLGQRLGHFARLSDMDHPNKCAAVEHVYRQLGATPDTIDAMLDEMMLRHI